MAVTAAIVVTSVALGAYLSYRAAKKATAQEPTPSDLQVQSSNRGIPIPVIYGTCKVAGNLIWYDNFQTIRHEEKQGGKGGGGGSSVWYTYTVSFAFGLCMGSADVIRIWKGDEEISLDQFTIYDGTQTTPDSHIASFTNRDPVYKNLCYVVAANFDLGESPYFPQFTFEVNGNVKPLERLDKLTVSGGSVLGYVGVDTLNGFAYAVTANWGGANTIYKIRLSDFTEVSTLAIGTGDMIYQGGVVDEDNGFLYLATYTSPAELLKIDLSDFSWDSTLSLGAGTNYATGVVLDSSNGKIYVSLESGGGASEVDLVKVDIATFTVDATLDVSGGDAEFQYFGNPVIDYTNNYLYMGSGWYTGSEYGHIVKVDLNTFTVDSSLNIANDQIFSLVIDETNGYLYAIMEGGAGDTPEVYKIDLSTFTSVDSLTLSHSFNYAGLIYRGSLYVAMQGGALDRIAQINLTDFTLTQYLDLVSGDNMNEAYVGFDSTTGIAYYVGTGNSNNILKIQLPFPEAGDILPPEVTEDILTNDLYGLGLNSSFIDSSVFTTTKTYCTGLDLLVSFAFDQKMSAIDALELVAGHHLGYFSVSSGQIQHQQIKSESSSKTLSRLTDFIESDAPIQANRRGARESKNRLNISYTKRDDSYTTGVETVNDEAHQIDYGLLEGEITYEGYTSATRASKVGLCMLARGLFIPSEYEFETGIKNLADLSPGSVITLSDTKTDGSDVDVRIVSMSENADGTVSVKVIEEIPIYIDDIDETESSSSLYVPIDFGGTVDNVINFGMAELPPMLSDDSNIVALSFSSTGGDNYAGIAIYESWDGTSYEFRENSGKDCLTAVVDSVDTDKITLTLSSDVTLDTVADIFTLLSTYGKNLCWDEEANIYFRFATASLIATRQWELTGIIWDVYGTPRLNYHAVSAGQTITFKAYSDDPHPLKYSDNFKGGTLYIKPVPFNKRGQVNDISTTTAYSKTFQGDGTRPYAPANLEVSGYGSATKITKADLTFQWESRNRLTFGLDYDYSDQIPEEDDFEQFDWSIYEGSNLLRTGNTTDTSFTYTEAMQTTDGDPTEISFIVNKKSTLSRSYDAQIDIEII